MLTLPRTLALAAPLLLLACGDDSGPTFKEAVHEVYAPCKPDPVKVAAAKKAMVGMTRTDTKEDVFFNPCLLHMTVPGSRQGV